MTVDGRPLRGRPMVAPVVPGRPVEPGGHAEPSGVDTSVTRRYFPQYDSGDGARPAQTGTVYKQFVTLDDILIMILRGGLAYRTMNKIPNTTFSAGYKVNADNELLQERARFYDKKLEVSQVYEKGMGLAKGMGVSLIALGFVESAATLDDPTQDPAGISDIDYIHPIDRTSISDIIVDQDEKSPNYGLVTHFELLVPQSGKVNKVKYPSSRFVHWVNEYIDDSPWGISMFHPPYNLFIALDSINKAAGVVPDSMARPLPVLTTPDNAGPNEVADAKASFKNITTAANFIHPASYDFKLLATNIALKIEEYARHILTQISASLTGSKLALLGAEAGTQSTSITNLMEWYSFVQGLQRNFCEPRILELFHVLQAVGILPAGEISIEWNEIYTLDAKEEAEVRLMNVQSLETMVRVIREAKAEGYEVSTTEGDLVLVSDETKLVVPGAHSMMGVVEMAKDVTAEPGHAPDEPQHADVPEPGGHQEADPAIPSTSDNSWLPREERDRLFDVWEFQTAPLSQSMRADMNKYNDTLTTQVQVQFKEEYERYIGPVDYDIALAPGQHAEPTEGDKVRLINAMKKWQPPGDPELEERMAQALADAYVEGAKQTVHSNEVMDEVYGPEPGGNSEPGGHQDFTFETLLDQDTLDVIDEYAEDMVSDTRLQGKRRAMFEIRDGIKKGDSYSEIQNRVGETMAKQAQDNIPRTVSKFVNTARAEGRHRMFNRLGYDDKDGYRIITVGDENVRDEHRDAEARSTPLTWSEVQDVVNDWECRCTYVTVPIWERATTWYNTQGGGF